MQIPRFISVSIGLLISLRCPEARAEMLTSQYLRGLAVSSETIVLVRAVEGSSLPEGGSQNDGHEHQTSFDVEEVLKGDPKLGSTTLRVRDRSLFVLSSGFRNGEQVKLQQAMLFLSKTSEGGWNLRYLYGLTKDDVVVRPIQMMNPGPYVLAEKPELTWPEAKRIIQRFLPQVEALKELRAIQDPAQRNQAVFRWINEHRGEFYGWSLHPQDRIREPRIGWGDLETTVFSWIFESGIHPDSWLALQMQADTCRYHLTSWTTDVGGTFTNISGRAFLLAKLVDPNQPLIARRTAAGALAQALNYGPVDKKSSPERNSVNRDEQVAVLNAALPLANHEDPILRREIIGLLLSATDPFNDASRPHKNKLALPVIAKALSAEQDNEILRDAPSRLNHLMDETEWRALTGNRERICVTISASQNEAKLQLQVCSKHLPYGAELPVEVIMERLDEHGTAVEVVSHKVASEYPKHWPKEWEGFMTLEPVPIDKLALGTWRVRLKGVSADARKLTWTSWHTCIRIP